MLKLVIGLEDQDVQSASVPLRWCLDKATLEKMAKGRIKNPLLLITVVPEKTHTSSSDPLREFDSRSETRYLVPIGQLMAFVNFRRSGKNRILSTVVWDWNGDRSKLRERFLSRDEGWYKKNVLNGSGGFSDQVHRDEDRRDQFLSFPADLGLRKEDLMAEFDVIVPEGLFAPAPPAWDRRWVNFLLNEPVEDQCAFRRRKIFAYTIQPIIVALWAIFSVLVRGAIAAWYLLWGVRGVNFGAILRTWSVSLDDFRESTWKDSQSLNLSLNDSVLNRSWKDKRGKKHSLFFLFAFAPASFLVVFLPLLLFHTLIGLVLVGFWFVVLLAVFGITVSVSSSKGTAKKAELTTTDLLLLKYRTEFVGLTCDGDLKPSVSSLPKRRQTVYLRFLDFKRKVCKPFAR